MTDGEKAVWAAAYAVYYHQKQNTRLAANQAAETVRSLREMLTTFDYNSTWYPMLKEMLDE